MPHIGSDDRRFVADLLQEASGKIADPRVQITHLHHESEPPSTTHDAEVERTPFQQRVWADVQSLALEVDSLWRHIWATAATPDYAEVEFREVEGQVTPVLRSSAPTRTSPDLIASIGDRLVVKGWLPEDDSATVDRLVAQRDGRALQVDLSADGMVTLSVPGEAVRSGSPAKELYTALRRLPSVVVLPNHV